MCCKTDMPGFHGQCLATALPERYEINQHHANQIELEYSFLEWTMQAAEDGDIGKASHKQQGNKQNGFIKHACKSAFEARELQKRGCVFRHGGSIFALRLRQYVALANNN